MVVVVVVVVVMVVHKGLFNSIYFPIQNNF